MNVNEEFDNSVELPVENMSKAAFAQWVTGVNSEVLELYYLKLFRNIYFYRKLAMCLQVHRSQHKP